MVVWLVLAVPALRPLRRSLARRAADWASPARGGGARPARGDRAREPRRRRAPRRRARLDEEPTTSSGGQLLLTTGAIWRGERDRVRPLLLGRRRRRALRAAPRHERMTPDFRFPQDETPESRSPLAPARVGLPLRLAHERDRFQPDRHDAADARRRSCSSASRSSSRSSSSCSSPREPLASSARERDQPRGAPARRPEPRHAARGAALGPDADRAPLPPDALRHSGRRRGRVAARGRRPRRAAAVALAGRAPRASGGRARRDDGVRRERSRVRRAARRQPAVAPRGRRHRELAGRLGRLAARGRGYARGCQRRAVHRPRSRRRGRGGAVVRAEPSRR